MSFKPLRHGAATLLSCTLLSAAPSALAHGGIPRAYEILAEPGNPDHTVLRSYIWGLMHTRNGGATWEYTCSEAYGGTSTGAEHLNMAVLPGGRLLVASSFKGLRYTDDGCNWETQPAFDGLIVQDTRLDPRPGGALYVVTSIGKDGSIEGKLWRSEDGGDTWAAFGEALPLGFAPKQIAFPQGASDVLYLSGGWVGGDGAVLLRSSDGGGTWVRNDLPLTGEDGDPRVTLVHPTDPDIAFVWADRSEQVKKDEPDKYLVTVDGGATWKVLFQGSGELSGFVLSPDGSKVYVGGSVDGLQEATLASALDQGHAAFQQVYEYGVWSLRFDGETLLVGGDNYGVQGDPEYTLGVSTDLGRSTDPTMSVCDLQFTACGPETTVGRLCEVKWSSEEGGNQQGLRSEYIAPRCMPRFNPPDGGGVVTGAVTRPDVKGEGGCTMSAAGTGSGGVLAGLLAVAAAARRRRRG